MTNRLSRIALGALSLALWSHVALAAERTVMITTWRGCEEACQGFQEYLDEAGHDIEFVLRDAGQDKAVLPGFLEEARAQNVDLIVTWGTSVTRGIAGTLENAASAGFDDGIPRVFMIVADPVGAGIVESLQSTGRDNVTGTYNRVPEKVVIATIRRYMPEFGHLGMLYNSSEANAVLKRDEVAELAGAEGFKLTSIDLDAIGGAAGINDGVAQLKAAGAEFLYVGSSSELRANAAALAAAAFAAGVPVISPYEEMVHNGTALISIAARYYDVGRLAGQQAERILYGGASPRELPVARLTNFALTVNMSFAKEVKALPPIDILQIAEIVD